MPFEEGITRARQYSAIKSRLKEKFHQERKERNITYISLAQDINTMNKSNDITPGTLRNTIETSEDQANLFIVLSLCRYWNLSFDTVCSPPETVDTSIPPGKLIPNSQVLDDENYMGRYGFMYSRNINHRYLLNFELELKRKEDQKAIAIMSIKSETNTNGEIRTIEGEEYIGTPLLIRSENLLFLPLVHRNTDINNQNSETAKPNYYLYMDYGSHSRGMYYRKGIAITRSTINSGPNSDQLIMENFVLFRDPLNRGDERYVHSMLPVMGDSFIISDEAISELAQDEEMATFFDKYSYNWRQKQNMISGHLVSFDHVIRSIRNLPDEKESIQVIRALLRLIAKSPLPLPSRVSYLEPVGMTEFAKSIQSGFSTQSTQH